MLMSQDDFWRAVPPRLDMLGEASGLGYFGLSLGFNCPTQAKVADFDIALIVDENICWFKIPVYNTCRVDEIDSAKQVVDNHDYVLLVKNGSVLG